MNPIRKRLMPPHDPVELITLMDTVDSCEPMAFAIEQRARINDLVAAYRLSGDNHTRRGHICYLLGYRQAKSTVGLLIEALDDESAYVRDQAADALGKIASPEAGPAIFERLLRADPRDSLPWLASAAAACGYRPVIPMLIEGLADGDDVMRGAAAWGLGRLKVVEAEDPLRKALETETDNFSRQEMREAIAIIQETKSAKGRLPDPE